MFGKQKLILGFACALLGSTAFASDGVDDTTVNFAQVAALDGAAAALGLGVQQGIVAAFEEANAKGGVHGRMLRLDSFDDGYEPDRSIEMVQNLIAGGNHIGIIGAVGTPTSQAIQPLTTEANIPFIGPFTGAGFLRAPELHNVLNVRASYDAETEAWIKHLVDDEGLTKIAILYQDDGFGRVGLTGVTQALERRGMTLVAEGTYTRNTTAVRSALLDIRKAEPEAVVMVGAYGAIGEFVRLAHTLKFEPEFVTISFVGSKALADDLGEDGVGVIISQVVPFPWDTGNTLVAEYTAALQAVDPAAAPEFVSLEGYIVGRLAIVALDKAGQDLTQATFMEAINNLGVVDLSGTKMTFGPGDNQGLDDVFLTRIGENGTFLPL